MKLSAFKRGLIYGCFTSMCIYHYGYSLTAFLIAAFDYNWNAVFTAITGIIASVSGIMFSIQGLILSLKKDRK